MPTCKVCNDTGVIKTGNNDIPCGCPAGDVATFNVACEGKLTGTEIKRRYSSSQIPTILCDRTEHGQFFKWYERPGFWLSTSGNLIMVVPPRTTSQSWLCIAPYSGYEEEPIEFVGHNAERRAFLVAEGFTRQNVTRAA